ncbi:phage tail assembly protein [Ochrobactrum sp. S46]|nr:phage tail assembly protein [Ochrobactrum sp. S45]MBK0044225.1 phage tail assembly protein [Ochrobactrum sp. S46]
MTKVTTVTVPLEYPIHHEGQEITELTFRRMKAKDTLVAEGEENKAKAGFLVFAALAGVDVEVIEDLDIEDLEAVGEKVTPLMGKSANAKIDTEKKPSLGETS